MIYKEIVKIEDKSDHIVLLIHVGKSTLGKDEKEQLQIIKQLHLGVCEIEVKQ